MENYTKEEREQALSVSLTYIAAQLGYTVQRAGHYHNLKEMDSLIIYNDKTWYRWSGKGSRNSGNQIDFVLEYGNCSSIPEAIHYLLGQVGYTAQSKIMPQKNKDRKVFQLPEKALSYCHLYAYLMNTRKLSKQVIDYFVSKKLLYEDARHHNLVFVGRDKDGNARFASRRGTVTMDGVKPFKRDVLGSDKNFGVNIATESSEIKVFEAAIDLMSYMDMTNDYESNKVVLGMINDKPLEHFLADHPHIKIITFCLDDDQPGREAVLGSDTKQGYMGKWRDRGYEVHVEFPGVGKDFNECLCSCSNVKVKKYGKNTYRKERS